MSDVFDPSAYGQSLRATMMGAAVEAQRRGADVAEAEHLLLALAAEARSPAGRVMADFGLDHAGVTRALAVERERSLRVAGVDPAASAGLQPTRLPPSRPRWGASVRDAAKRGMESAAAAGRRERRLWRATDLLIGLLALEVGTVPRALAYAGIDTDAMAAAARAAGGAPPDGGRGG